MMANCMYCDVKLKNAAVDLCPDCKTMQGELWGAMDEAAEAIVMDEVAERMGKPTPSVSPAASPRRPA